MSNFFERPFFSIVIPTCNRKEFLLAAIDSVLNQSFKNFEVLIINDGSYFELDELVLEELQGNIKLINLNEGRGPAYCRNRGIEAAVGRYVSFLDDDDILCDTFLDSTFSTIQSDLEATQIVWSGVLHSYEDELGNVVRTEKQCFSCEGKSVREIYEDFMSIGIGYGVTISSSLLNEVNNFTPSLKVVEDTDLFLKIIAKKYIPKINSGVQVKIRHHLKGRLTDAAMNLHRLRESQYLLMTHTSVFLKYPSIRRQLQYLVDNLTSEKFQKII